jgi:hypothetical protein
VTGVEDVRASSGSYASSTGSSGPSDAQDAIDAARWREFIAGLPDEDDPAWADGQYYSAADFTAMIDARIAAGLM